MGKAYKEWYEKVSAPYKNMSGVIVMVNKTLTMLTYIAYPMFLALFYIKANPDFHTMAKLIAVPAISFVLLSVIRDKIDRPRPYEQWDIDKIIAKETRGHSMPSRHVFSMSIISMVFLYISVPLGVIFLIRSALLAFLRVIGGVHYPSDVIVGYIVGVVSGALIFII